VTFDDAGYGAEVHDFAPPPGVDIDLTRFPETCAPGNPSGRSALDCRISTGIKGDR
jgi:hypothetical protein